MKTLATGADGLPSPRKEGLTTLKLKVVVLCAVVAVMTAIADGGRPRLFLRPHLLPGLRERCMKGDLVGRYAGWCRDARRAIGADLPPEPPVLPKQQPDRNREYARAFRTVRPPTRLMQICALVYKLGGDPEIGAEAKRRVLYYFGWDPHGTSSTLYNDEPAMSVMRNGCRAYDWTYELYTPEERAKIEACIAERARQIYQVLQRRKFHVNPADSHLGRQIGFLAEACCAIMPEHPEMREWYDYVMNVYRTVYPAWSRGDGGWNEGPHYWGCYMDFGLDSLTAVKLATGDDIVSAKPFFRLTPWYFIYQCPPGSPISPFGDGSQANPQSFGCIRSFAVLLNDPELLWFAKKYGRAGIDGARDLVLDPVANGLTPRAPKDLPGTRCFKEEGLVMSHSCLTNAAEDVAFYFRSTPYGSVSHGHQDQNAFALAAYGEPLAIASGYYDFYGSPHHDRWTRQTKAKCAITFDGGRGQPRGAQYKGKIAHFESSGDVVSFTGDASEAYGLSLTRARRDVVRLGANLFLLRDDLASPKPHKFEFNLHAKDDFELDEGAREVTIRRPHAALTVRFLQPAKLAYSQTKAFDPPVDERDPARKVRFVDQAHFRAATEPCAQAEIVTLLEVSRPGEQKQGAVATCTDTPEGSRVRVDYGGRRYDVLFPRGDAPVSTVVK